MTRILIASLGLLVGTQSAFAQCDAAGGVYINEIMPNSAGSDTDNEWVELVNSTGTAKDISGWTLWAGTSSYNTSFVIPPATMIAPGQHLLLGGANVIGADIVYPQGSPNLTMGNASSSCDAIRIDDCFATVADTVVYGPDNTNDGWLDDNGVPVGQYECAPEPFSDQSVARITTGFDTNSMNGDFDWYSTTTPGDLNLFKIWADAPMAGMPTNVYVRGAMPGTNVIVGASLTGEGMGPVFPFATADILAPINIGSATSDASRMATLAATVPAGLAYADVWLQAGVPTQAPAKSTVWMGNVAP